MDDWKKYQGGIYYVKWSENWQKWIITNGVCMTGCLWVSKEEAQDQCDKVNKTNLLETKIDEQLSLF